MNKLRKIFQREIQVRFTIAILAVILYLFIAISIRPMAYNDNWNQFLQSLLGCIPNFIACIGIVNLFKIFYPNENTSKLILVCVLTLIFYEIFSGSSRKTGIGITFDFLDIIATISGAIVAFYIEIKSDSLK
ncbi:MAG TPA: hypothetical protein PLH86_03140 [Saprospiraceae bacterium]|nr:hypothetical protein [Saprospiraceae bacterium]